jgi:RNA polymerase sigma-70 factor (ECF subfamily)
MDGPPRGAERYLTAARAGSPEALGQLLEAYRDYLLLIAAQELPTDLRAKCGASDLVQDTLLEAQRDFPQFRGDTDEQLRGWLRQLLRHNLGHVYRHFRDTAKRRLGREVRLEGDRPSRNVGAGLAADDSTPSAQAMAHERARAVRQALDRLPEDYRQVLLLRFQEGLSFEEIGRRLGRSANAAEKLFARAIQQMEKELEAPP